MAMRFNKQELATLATQPSNKFEKEGILHVTERQDGFFRRTEGTIFHYHLVIIIIFVVSLQVEFFPDICNTYRAIFLCASRNDFSIIFLLLVRNNNYFYQITRE